MAGFARRRGKDCLVATINGKTARDPKVDLRFLGAGNWTLVSLADDPARTADDRASVMRDLSGMVDGRATVEHDGGRGRFQPPGAPHALKWGHDRGDRVGLLTFHASAEHGHADFTDFRYRITLQNG